MKRKPRPTEYKGTVFDSKSEAVFARVLDECGNHWAYHPPADGHHEWDFFVFANQTIDIWSTADYGGREYKTGSDCLRRMNSCPNVLVEYKPRKPTDTYITELKNDWKNYVEDHPNSYLNAVIVFGSPWEKPHYDVIAISDPIRSMNALQHFALECLFDINSRAIESAMSYRFDLQSGGIG